MIYRNMVTDRKNILFGKGSFIPSLVCTLDVGVDPK